MTLGAHRFSSQLQARALRKRRARNGFNLIEAAIVLGVAGLVIGGIWIAANTVTSTLKATQTVQDLMTIARNTQQLISIKDSVAMGNGRVLTTTLIAARAVPDSWIKTSTTLSNPYNGSTSISSFISPPRFDIYLNGIPPAACAQLLFKLGGLGAASDRASSGTSGSKDRTGLGYLAVLGSGWSTHTFPVSLGAAQTACNADSNDLVITFGYLRVN